MVDFLKNFAIINVMYLEFQRHFQVVEVVAFHLSLVLGNQVKFILFHAFINGHLIYLIDEQVDFFFVVEEEEYLSIFKPLDVEVVVVEEKVVELHQIDWREVQMVVEVEVAHFLLFSFG